MPTTTETTAATTEPSVAEQFADAGQQWRADLLGMWVFLLTEIMMFGGMFMAFAIYRVEYAEVFAEGAHHLKLHLGAINTVLLLTSGLCMSLADPAVRAGRRATVLVLLALTAALALIFLGIKGYEYHTEYQEHLVPIGDLPFDMEPFSSDRVKVFFSFYYVMTGLHALHMAVGVGLIGAAGWLVARWRDGSRVSRQVQIISIYWAFVDVVWLLLFPTLYLLRPATGG